MGINQEFVATLLDLRSAGALDGHTSVIELGAQDVAVDPSAVADMLAEHGIDLPTDPVHLASDLYAQLGYGSYAAIDANGLHGATVFDLNRDLRNVYDFTQTFDLVTNLGTLEHCFDQATAFRNMHRLCRPGGYMIHCLPTQGLVNHAFYNYHPRFVADLAAANGYEIERIFFTENFRPERISYSIDEFRRRDTQDLMLYTVLRRNGDADFQVPFDGIFSSESRVPTSNKSTRADIQAGDFQAYIKGSWSNIRVPYAPDSPAGKRKRDRLKSFIFDAAKKPT